MKLFFKDGCTTDSVSSTATCLAQLLAQHSEPHGQVQRTKHSVFEVNGPLSYGNKPDSESSILGLLIQHDEACNMTIVPLYLSVVQ